MHVPELCRGFILNQHGSVFSLLSLQEGRIEKIIDMKKEGLSLYRGSFITYQTTRKNFSNRFFIANIQLDLCATQLAGHDIYLLHAIIEFCYFFIPLGSHATQIFYFLLELFEHYYTSFYSFALIKKILCKLFIFLGIYPEEAAIQVFAQQIEKMPIDNLLTTSLQLECDELINKWLAWCIDMHPKKKFFKAMPLLLKSDKP